MSKPQASPGDLSFRFFFFGLGACASAILWLILQPDILFIHYYNPHTVAWVHLFVLGFVLSIVIGSLYQITPVILESKLFSLKLTRLHGWFHILGVSFMIVMFYRWQLPGVAMGGGLVITGVTLLIFNLVCTMRKSRDIHVVILFVIVSLTWMLITMGLGLLIALHRVYALFPWLNGPWTPVHVHFGLGGIFVNLIMGVSLRLTSMFLVSEIQNEKRALGALILFNLGLICMGVHTALELPFLAPLNSALMILGILLWLWETYSILYHRKRRAVDYGIRLYFAGLIFLFPIMGIGYGMVLGVQTNFLDSVSLATAYGILILFGFLGSAILGMLHKIIPFLVWQRAYKNLIGIQPVPALSEMLSSKLQITTCFLYPVGVTFIVLGILFHFSWMSIAATWVTGAGLILFFINLFLILRHLFRKQSPPAPISSSSHAST